MKTTKNTDINFYFYFYDKKSNRSGSLDYLIYLNFESNYVLLGLNYLQKMIYKSFEYCTNNDLQNARNEIEVAKDYFLTNYSKNRKLEFLNMFRAVCYKYVVDKMNNKIFDELCQQITEFFPYDTSYWNFDLNDKDNFLKILVSDYKYISKKQFTKELKNFFKTNFNWIYKSDFKFEFKIAKFDINETTRTIKLTIPINFYISIPSTKNESSEANKNIINIINNYTLQLYNIYETL